MFYSIIADTTQDISKKDQLSSTIRYAKITNDSTGQAAEISMAKQQRYQWPSSRGFNGQAAEISITESFFNLDT